MLKFQKAVTGSPERILFVRTLIKRILNGKVSGLRWHFGFMAESQEDKIILYNNLPSIVTEFIQRGIWLKRFWRFVFDLLAGFLKSVAGCSVNPSTASNWTLGAGESLPTWLSGIAGPFQRRIASGEAKIYHETPSSRRSPLGNAQSENKCGFCRE